MRLLLFALAAFAAWGQMLSQVHSIYILPMGNSMDQFLANRLTQFGRFQIVTDPKAADAIMTDRLGEGFEAKLRELYAVKEPKDDKAKADQPAFKSEPQVRPAFVRGKGTVFIVDPKTRAVLWSTYQRPKNSSADELNKTAQRVVKQLKQDLETPRQAGT